VFLKLFEKIYASLTAGLVEPFPGDRKLVDEKRSPLDRLDPIKPSPMISTNSSVLSLEDCGAATLKREGITQTN
jgi:hypothetical protein